MLSNNKIFEIIEQWKRFVRKDFHKREITDKIINRMDKEVIDIIGVRRSGKSTLLNLLINKLELEEDDFLYINFEEPSFINNYGVELLEKIWEVYKLNYNPGNKPYIFFDEIQLVPGWEKWIRKIRDLELAHVFVTGSSSKLLSREFGTALTGRHVSFKLFPLNFKEYIEFKGGTVPKTAKEMVNEKIGMKRFLKDYLLHGGFPEVVLTENDELLKNYFEDIIYRDIILRHEIRDVDSLRKLANFCMTNISNPLSYNSLRKTLKMSLDSVKNYLKYMEEAFLLFQVPLFSYSLKTQEYSAKKIYCIDNGLRNAVSFKFSKDIGRLAENLVFIELKRRGMEVYYWKDKNEVDFVMKKKDNSLKAVNVTYTNKIKKREVRGLKEFKKKYKKTNKLVLITKDLEKHENGVDYIPLWKWLLKE